MLKRLDARRASAWRRDDPGLLRAVYTPGSPELAADRRMLRGYLARDLRVTGVDMRFLVVAVERQRPGLVALLVVDRLGRAVAHDRSGRVQALPHDLPTRHEIVLRLLAGGWRIARITLA